MEAVIDSLSGVAAFALYFALSLVYLMVFVKLYSATTPHDEVALIKENNPAASTAFVGAMIGFVLPLYSALSNSVDLIDFAVWGLVAMLVQIVTFQVTKKLFYPRISERITEGEVAAAIKMAGISVAVGILNAGSMTY